MAKPKKTMLTTASLIHRINETDEIKISANHEINILEDKRSWNHLSAAIAYYISKGRFVKGEIKYIKKHKGMDHKNQPLKIPLITSSSNVFYFTDHDEFVIIKNKAWNFIESRLAKILEDHLWEHRESSRIKKSLEALVGRKNLKK